MFLGLLTYSSAFSAPLTGAIADRFGQRRVLITSSVAITIFTILYGVLDDHRLMLALVPIHGVFWSGLLSASAAYMTNLLPERRRAEGIGYWGLSTVAALALAPSIGFWIYRRGWLWLCVVGAALNVTMGVIAWMLPDDRAGREPHPPHAGGMLEWRVLILSLTLFLYSFGYGGITSFTALYADANNVKPQAVYLTTLAIVILIIRPMAGRLGDRLGYKRVFIPCLILICAGLTTLAIGGSRTTMILSAILFGTGFGTAYPVYVGYTMSDVSASRRGAAFGAILAAFDTGIGAGSTSMGWLIQHHGFRTAWTCAAALSALALPYFLVMDRILKRRAARPT
jgi:MFS family permease